jgi:type IV pilus assembly protein PilA
MRMPTASDRGFTLVEVMIVVAILGILAALAIPSFLRFQARSKQAEVKTNLKAVFTGQKSAFSNRDRYSTSVAELGFAPERGNRYRYELDVACADEELRDMEIATLPGMTPCAISADFYRFGPQFTTAMLVDLAGAGAVMATAAAVGIVIPSPTAGIHASIADCPTCAFIARSVGQIDNDEGDDEWFISSENLVVGAAGCAENGYASPGSPINSRNDVTCD